MGICRINSVLVVHVLCGHVSVFSLGSSILHINYVPSVARGQKNGEKCESLGVGRSCRHNTAVEKSKALASE